MPVTLPAISRRHFLKASAALGLGLAVLPELLNAGHGKPDPHRLALLSDLHVASDPGARERGVVMYDNLRRVCRQVMALDSSPTAVLINGDCAYHVGRTADYLTLLGLLEPMRRSGLTLHLSMGNHDSRENLWKSIPGVEEHVPPLPHRQIEILALERANVFLLDSLVKTNSTPGRLGERQLQWLDEALKAHDEKPAIVFVHHQPDEHTRISGLLDTQAFLDVLLARKQVKALFYGHTHEWVIGQRHGIHCVNLPAVAYVFKKGQPSGWVDARLREDGMSIQLLCLDKSHPKHLQKADLNWRA